MSDDANIRVELDLPELIVIMDLDFGMEAEIRYHLADVIDIVSDETAEIEIVDVHWHGIVLADSDNETHHIDLRDLQEEHDGDR